MRNGSQSINLEHLGEQLTIAKERLSVEKLEILKRDPLPTGFNREEYIFAYLRAERTGMSAINARLAEISWLPMQLDPQSELIADNKNPIKRWLNHIGGGDPTADDFGNDFIHALTRCNIAHGVDHPRSKKLLLRTAGLFRDLSCLIGMIYYTSWLAEHDIEGISLSDPEDLHRSVVEIAALVQSPEMQRALRQRAEQMKKLHAKKASEKLAAKAKPLLRLISNNDMFMADTVPV